jgi:hypothetical protein
MPVPTTPILTIEASVKMPDGRMVAHVGPMTSALPPDGDGPTHGPGFVSVRYRGQLYWFTPLQRLIVAHLWEAWENGSPFVDAKSLCEAADVGRLKLKDVFRDSDAWGEVIVDARTIGGPVGAYCLAWAGRPA